MKRFIIGLVAAATLALPIGAALADPPPGGPPGQGACDVGNSDNTCVPDPNENGQDCEEHGNSGGINENHCITTTVTTTTSAPPPTCEETQTCETTTTTPTQTPPTETETTTTTTPPSTTTTAPPSSTSTTAPPVTTEPDDTEGPTGGPGKLAFTGVEDVVPIGAAALALLSGGSYLLWRGRKRDDE